MSDIEKLVTSIEKCASVTFSTQSAISKTILLSMLVRDQLQKERQVHYFDFDLQFSSWVASNERYHNQSSSLLNIVLPAENQVTNSIISILSSTPSKGGLVVVDSINTLQTMLRIEDKNVDWPKANHETSILLSLIAEFSDRYSKTLVISSIEKLRPNRQGSEDAWERELGGGRVIRFRSRAIFSVIESQDRMITVQTEYLANGEESGLVEGDAFTFSQDSLFLDNYPVTQS